MRAPAMTALGGSTTPSNATQPPSSRRARRPAAYGRSPSSRWRPAGKVTPHYHLTYSERFKVLEGQLTVEIDGVHHELEPGDEAVAAVRSLHAWSNPGEDRSVVQVELRPGSPGFENGLRVAYGLAADGLVRKNGVPRNPLHAALVLQMGEVRLPGGYAALERVLGLLARVARWRGVDRELERRYL